MRVKLSFVLPVTAALIGTATAPVLAQNTDRTELVKRATALQNAKDWDGAEKLYTQAIALDPKEPKAWINRGYVRDMASKKADAIADYSSGLTAIALSDNSAHLSAIALVNRAVGWRNRPENDDHSRKDASLRALVDATAACEREPDNWAAWSTRCEANYGLGNLEQARICLKKAQRLNSNVSLVLTEEVARLNGTGRRPVEQNPNTKTRFEAALAAQTAGENDKALALYSEIVEVEPLNATAWGNRGNLHFKAGRLDFALDDYATAISAASVNKWVDVQANTLMNRSKVYSGQKRYAEAINDLELVIKLDPKYTKAQEMLKIIRDNLTSQSSLPSKPPTN